MGHPHRVARRGEHGGKFGGCGGVECVTFDGCSEKLRWATAMEGNVLRFRSRRCPSRTITGSALGCQSAGGRRPHVCMS